MAKMRWHSHRLQLLHKTHSFQQRLRLHRALHAHRPKPKTLRDLGLPKPQNGRHLNLGKRRSRCKSSGRSLIQRRTLLANHVQNSFSLLASNLKSKNNFESIIRPSTAIRKSSQALSSVISDSIFIIARIQCFFIVIPWTLSSASKMFRPTSSQWLSMTRANEK